MSKISWIKESPEFQEYNDYEYYYLDSIKKQAEVTELCQNHYLAVKKEDLIVNFALFEFAQSKSNGSNMQVSVVFYGTGPSEGLRECRHTWWGDEDGYVFYPDGRAIALAFKELSKYFDDMV